MHHSQVLDKSSSSFCVQLPNFILPVLLITATCYSSHVHKQTALPIFHSQTQYPTWVLSLPSLSSNTFVQNLLFKTVGFFPVALNLVFPPHTSICARITSDKDFKGFLSSYPVFLLDNKVRFPLFAYSKASVHSSASSILGRHLILLYLCRAQTPRRSGFLFQSSPYGIYGRQSNTWPLIV